jgi:hypothetical protein
MRLSKVFLGGTCADSNWREELIKMIQIDHFNPVVDDWTEDCIEIENVEKESLCNIHLYVITYEMQGVYSIAEAVQSSVTKGISTIFHVIPKGFGLGQVKSLDAVCGLIRNNGGIAYIDNDLSRTARVINNAFKTTEFK